jgi:hypothetical protein
MARPLMASSSSSTSIMKNIETGTFVTANQMQMRRGGYMARWDQGVPQLPMEEY